MGVNNKRVMIVNDDGPDSKGLLALAKAFSDLGHEVLIATTSSQRSGSSKSVSFEAGYVLGEIGGFRSLVVDGTPASAVIIALTVVEFPADIVVSGINIGPNLGLWDILSSGTVGAAMEGALHGKPGIAVSLVAGSSSEYEGLSCKEYEEAANIVVGVLDALNWSIPCDVLNLNIPLRRNGKVRITVPEREPPRNLYRCTNSRCRMGYWTLSGSYPCISSLSDVCAVKEGSISLTPLSINTLSTGNTETIRKLQAIFLNKCFR
jgi:5'-nucleotidase